LHVVAGEELEIGQQNSLSDAAKSSPFLIPQHFTMADYPLRVLPFVFVSPTSEKKAAASSKPSHPSKKKQRTWGHSPPQALCRIIRGTNNVVLCWRSVLGESQRGDRRRAEDRRQILSTRMKNVTISALITIEGHKANPEFITPGDHSA
jgi:hypothetical protein